MRSFLPSLDVALVLMDATANVLDSIAQLFRNQLAPVLRAGANAADDLPEVPVITPEDQRLFTKPDSDPNDSVDDSEDGLLPEINVLGWSIPTPNVHVVTNVDISTTAFTGVLDSALDSLLPGPTPTFNEFVDTAVVSTETASDSLEEVAVGLRTVRQLLAS